MTLKEAAAHLGINASTVLVDEIAAVEAYPDGLVLTPQHIGLYMRPGTLESNDPPGTPGVYFCEPHYLGRQRREASINTCRPVNELEQA